MTDIDTIDTAWRENEVLNDPGTPKYRPKKPPQRRVLKRIESLASKGAVGKALEAELQGLVKSADTPALVYGDPVKAKRGWYTTPAGDGAWTKVLDIGETVAELEVTGGTNNAVQVSVNSYVDAANVLVFYIDIPAEDANTEPVTISIAGGDFIPAYNVNGDEFAPGEWQGRLLLSNEGTSLKALIDAGAAASAALSATAAAGSATEAGNQVAGVIPSLQRFAVGGVVQSVDLGNPELVGPAVRVFIDGVYQFSDTWSISAGVIAPVGGTWPGDGVIENMEVIIDATSAIVFNVPSNGSVSRDKILAGAVGEDELDPAVLAQIEESTAADTRIFSTALPFGRAGLRVLLGERYDAHYGLPSGWLVFPSGKWTLIYRKATDHGITDGAEIRAADSYDQGATLVNDRLIYSDPTHDARPDSPRLFANGRSGFMVNRQDEGSTHFSPLLIYSDDEFETWGEKVLTISSPYTFQSNGGIMDFPASQGGHDTMGFIAFGFVSDTYGRISTDDNWETYTAAGGVAELAHTPATGTAITTLSEWAGGRVPGEDKWIFYLRCQDADGWRDEAACFVTTNLLNWGSAVPSNINLGGNPPCVFGDEDTNQLHFVAFGRGGRGIDGFDHHMLIASADADELWAAAGDWSALPTAVDWKVVTPVPNWATGYMSPVKVGESWVATFVCGEPGTAGGIRSILAMIGDFVPSTTDVMKLAEAFRWNAIFKNVRANFSDTSSPPDTAAFSAGVDSVTNGFLSFNAGTTTRTHYAVRNDNGQIGSISAGGSATAFNTSSDGRIKVARVPIEEEADLDAVWEAIEPLAYTMLSGKDLSELDGRWFGLIAQDLFAVWPHAVTPGHGEPGEPGFVPWAIDYSKIVPLVLARQKQFERRTNERLAALEGGE